jgi:hypothetical protein
MLLNNSAKQQKQRRELAAKLTSAKNNLLKFKIFVLIYT